MNGDDFVEVTGEGSAAVTPDRVLAHLGAESVATSVGEALAQADRTMQAMVAALRDRGVADTDLRTTVLGVHADHHRSTGRPFRMLGSMGLRVSFDDIGTAGALVSAAVQAGGEACRVHGITLDVADPSGALARARETAWADATARARQYAALADRELGPVLQVTEDQPRGGPVVPMAAAGGMGAGPTIEAGSERLAARVTVRWRLV
jgi:uncharacterized protein YggE